MKRLAAGLLLGGIAGLAAWQAALALQNEAGPEPAPAPAEPSPAPEAATAPSVAPAPQVSRKPAVSQVTPMAQRVAVLGLLNKRNGISRDIRLHPGQAVRVGDIIVRLRACETTAPWENEKLTGAFVQLDVQQPDSSWRRFFSGWVYKESPSLNVVEHPVYDIWPKSCAMSFPPGPPPPAAPSGPAVSSNRSSAPNSADEPPPEAESPAPETAAPSNAT